MGTRALWTPLADKHTASVTQVLYSICILSYFLRLLHNANIKRMSGIICSITPANHSTLNIIFLVCRKANTLQANVDFYL